MNKRLKEPRDWEAILFEDLAQLPEIERLRALGETISRINPLLTRLARDRRDLTVDLIESKRYEYYELAQEVGQRVQTVRRLVDEGRAQRRAEAIDHAA